LRHGSPAVSASARAQVCGRRPPLIGVGRRRLRAALSLIELPAGVPSAPGEIDCPVP